MRNFQYSFCHQSEEKVFLLFLSYTTEGKLIIHHNFSSFADQNCILLLLTVEIKKHKSPHHNETQANYNVKKKAESNILVILISPIKRLGAVNLKNRLLIMIILELQLVVHEATLYELQILHENHVMSMDFLSTLLPPDKGCDCLPSVGVPLINHGEGQLEQLILLPAPPTHQTLRFPHENKTLDPRVSEGMNTMKGQGNRRTRLIDLTKNLWGYTYVYILVEQDPLLQSAADFF